MRDPGVFAVHVDADKARYVRREKQKQTRDLIFFSILVLDALLIFSFYLLLWRAVLKSLQAIEHYANLISSGDRQQAASFTASLSGEFA